MATSAFGQTLPSEEVGSAPAGHRVIASTTGGDEEKPNQRLGEGAARFTANRSISQKVFESSLTGDRVKYRSSSFCFVPSQKVLKAAIIVADRPLAREKSKKNLTAALISTKSHCSIGGGIPAPPAVYSRYQPGLCSDPERGYRQCLHVPRRK